MTERHFGNEPSPVATPQTPGVARPKTPPEPAPTLREITRALGSRIARFFGFTDYRAEVAERIVGVYIVADLSKPSEQEETRTGADYRTLVVDLTAANNRAPIAGTKDLVASDVALVAISGGASVSLHVGDRDPIPFGGTGLGVGSGLSMEPPEQTALAVTNTAQPGASATFLVSTGMSAN